ncbi:MAG: NAD(P)-dependent oxidoreductase [Candidatus Rokuibacteriota bacterium]
MGSESNHVDLEAATRFGILVTNTPGTNAAAVAELTMGLILSLARELVQANDLLRDRGWELLVGAEVGGKVLGIIGFGAIGRKVASLAKCFGMDVLAYSPRADKDGGTAQGVRFVSLDEVLQEADYVTIHTSLRDETRHLVGERELQLMKRGACLVNTARGGIVDEEALCRMLVERRIRGVALDVFASEPAIGSRLIGLPGVITTPHIGGSTGEAFARTSESVADSIEAVSRGEQPTKLVNPDAWLRYMARWA